MIKPIRLDKRQSLLIQVIITCSAIYAASHIVALSTALSITALVLGMGHALFKKWQLPLQQKYQFLGRFKCLWIGIFLGIVLLLFAGILPEAFPILYTLMLFVQVLGFYNIGRLLLTVQQAR